MRLAQAAVPVLPVVPGTLLQLGVVGEISRGTGMCKLLVLAVPAHAGSALGLALDVLAEGPPRAVGSAPCQGIHGASLGQGCAQHRHKPTPGPFGSVLVQKMNDWREGFGVKLRKTRTGSLGDTAR